MGAWEKVRRFFDRGEPLRAPMDDPFIQIDRERVAASLRLRERGAEQGALQQPPESIQTLDAVEADVASFIQQHFERAQIDAANSLRTYDSRLSGLELIANLSSIGTQAQVALGDFKVEVVNRRGGLANSRNDIVESYAELRDFKAANGLGRRPAHDVPPAVATYGTMAVCWLMETVANSVLLRLNDDMGWLGGVVAAAIVGAINVFVAAVVGRLVWPWVNRRGTGARAAGWVGVALWLAFVLAWNLMAAHYRDAKSMGLPEPETAALAMLGQGLHSIYSYGLLVAGVAFAVAAAIAGYRMDDPFPGYGPVSRRHADRCDFYVADVEDATAQLTDIRNRAIQEATDVRMELGRQLATRRQVLTYRDAFRRRYEEYAEQLEATGNALLQEYRTANRAARTAPAPPRFDLPWTLPRAALPHPPGEDIPRSALDEAEADLDGTVRQISRAFDEAIDSFEPLDELKRRIADG